MNYTEDRPRFPVNSSPVWRLIRLDTTPLPESILPDVPPGNQIPPLFTSTSLSPPLASVTVFEVMQ